MDNLKSLMDKKEYELVIKLTKSSKDMNSLFYRISALVSLGEVEEALKIIDNNQKILEGDLAVLIKVHIELLCLSNKFDEAREKLKYYENLPYESQVVEETLKIAPELIKEEEKKITTFKYLSEEKLLEKLKSDDNNDVIMALDIIKERDIFAFLNPIYNLMINNEDQLIRSFALLLLVHKELDRNVKYKSSKGIISVNPKTLKPPFIGTKFNNLTKQIQNKFKDASLANNAIAILSGYILYIYPETIDNINLDTLFSALFIISKDYMGDPTEEGLDKEGVKELVNEIRKSLKEND